jgi:hypothetical protein
MSIYIKGMGMPKDGNETIIRIQPDGTVLDQYGHHLAITALPVPEHGDLVDRKVAFDYWLCAANDFCWSPTDENFKKALEATPTIIPADDPDNNVGNIPTEEGE